MRRSKGVGRQKFFVLLSVLAIIRIPLIISPCFASAMKHANMILVAIYEESQGFWHLGGSWKQIRRCLHRSAMLLNHWVGSEGTICHYLQWLVKLFSAWMGSGTICSYLQWFSKLDGTWMGTRGLARHQPGRPETRKNEGFLNILEPMANHKYEPKPPDNPPPMRKNYKKQHC